MKRASMMPGERNHHLVAIDRQGVDESGAPLWRFRCDCGAERIIRARDVRSGNTKGCGCRRAIGRKFEAERSARASRVDALLRQF